MGRHKPQPHSPLTVTAVAAGTAAVLALALGPAASAASTDAATARRAAHTATAAGPHAVPGGHHETVPLRLADTGSVDTTPYVIGGTAFLVVGTGLLAAARQRAQALTD